MSSTSKLYPPADISKQTVLVTGAERRSPGASGWTPKSYLTFQHIRAGASSGIGEACAWRFAEAGSCLLTSRMGIGGCSSLIKMQLMAHLCRLQAGADSPENRKTGEASQGLA